MNVLLFALMTKHLVGKCQICMQTKATISSMAVTSQTLCACIMLCDPGHGSCKLVKLPCFVWVKRQDFCATQHLTPTWQEPGLLSDPRFLSDQIIAHAAWTRV